jgi:hypothetical protein
MKGIIMLIDEIKATLALENLNLTAAELELLEQYAQGLLDIQQLKSILQKDLNLYKAA